MAQLSNQKMGNNESTLHHLTNLPSPQNYIDLVRDILNKSLQLDLETWGNVNNNYGANLAQFYTNNEAAVLVQVRRASEIRINRIGQLIRSISNEINKLNPGRYILVYYDDIDLPELKTLETGLVTKKSANLLISYYNLKWIEDQLIANPSIAELHKVNLKEIIERRKLQQPVLEIKQVEDLIRNNISHLGKKYKSIQLSKVFYFQKAREVLDELKWFGNKNDTHGKGGKLGIEISQHTLTLYEQLYLRWEDKKSNSSSAFLNQLDGENSELYKLFKLISRFISYLDEKAWNKRSLNQYEDKRVIARAFVRQHHWVTHFLKYALNKFEKVEDNTGQSFNRIIDYLERPDVCFNILSDRHIKMISNFFLKKNAVGNEFHILLRSYFGQFGFTFRNNENATFLYTAIIYDDLIKQHWYDHTKETESLGEIDADINDEIEEDSENVIIQPTSAVLNSNDSAHAKNDLLGFEPDIEVMASLMALRKMRPPLAIALFGKWGTGKSFFMFQLQKKINELALWQGFLKPKEGKTGNAEPIDDNKYCKGIAQINFNAWSYVDSNLWAGLVNTIFEKLNEYINDSTKSGVAKLKVRTKLMERLATLKSSRLTVAEKKSGFELLKDEYEEEKKQLERDIQGGFTKQLIKVIDQSSDLKALHNKVISEPYSNNDLIEIKNSQVVVDFKIWRNFILNIRSLSSYKAYVIIAIAIAAGLFGANYLFNLFESDFTLISTISVLLSKCGIDLKKLISKYKQVKSYTKKFNEFIEDKKDLQEKVGIIENNIKNARHEIDEADKQISTLSDKINSLENKISKDITNETIADFINDRANHKDYKDHLGIVSTIRKDFETLSELFIESNGIGTDDSGKTSTNKELSEDRKEINQQFKKDRKLERIILYIDDLDRCSDEKVLEVLQAVHLLMAFPLFVVVVGVDKRCVSNALNYKNILQYFNTHGVTSLEQLKEEFEIEIIKPNEYLEKIFQIPFQISDADSQGINKLIDDLFEGQIKDEVAEQEELDDGIEERKPDLFKEVSPQDIYIKTNGDIPKSETQFAEKDIEQEFNHETEQTVGVDNAKSDNQLGTEGDIKKDNKKDSMTLVTPPDLTITTAEKEQVKKLSYLVGNTPRTIKRYVNLYRILRAHSQISFKGLSDNQRLGIMFALAINIGKQQTLAKKLFKVIDNKGDEPLFNYLTEEDFPEFFNGLNEAEMLSILDISCDDITSKLPFINRFSFGCLDQQDQEEKNKETPILTQSAN